MLQARNPVDLGGLYWSANLILSQASVVACTLLYHLYYEEDVADAQRYPETFQNTTLSNSTVAASTKLTEDQLKTNVGILFTIFLISFTLFMLKIERKYLWTFFSAETAHGKTKRLFRTGKDDFEKSQILRRQKRQWTSIRPQVAEWLDANWDKWERDKPDWFNAVFIESVDDDIMPARVLARLKQESEGRVRRRSSFMERVSARVQERENDEEGSESDGSGGEDAR